MLLNVTLCDLVRIRRIKLLSLTILSSITANEEKILGITIDNKLTFKSHVKILCRKALIGALSSVLSHLNDSQKRSISNFHNKI